MKIELCKTIDSIDSFVGIKIENGITKVYFPYGYPVEESKKLNDLELRKQIRYLLYTISGTKADIKLNTQIAMSEESNYLYDCMYLIEEFFKNGIYKDKKQVSTTISNGKINWKRTINKQIPLISNQNNTISSIYFKNIYKDKYIFEESLVSQLHLFALEIAKNNVGFLYSDFYIDKPELDQPDKMICILIDRMKKTFIDSEKKLFEAIVNVILNKGKKYTPVSFKMGTTSYHVVWENMLRKVYGTLDESKFFPMTTYTLKRKGMNSLNRVVLSTMRPDLLFKPKNRNEYYVIDAKYYKYFESNFDSNNLPASESISKQIIYQQKIEEQLVREKVFTQNYLIIKKPVRSMFILPYNKNKFSTDEYISSSINELAFKGFGTIETNQFGNQTYSISLAFKDTKDLIIEYNEGRKYHYDSQYENIVTSFEEYNDVIKTYKIT